MLTTTENLRRVTQHEFFARMNLNVHPRISSRWNRVTGYLCAWKLQDGERETIGYSDGGTHLTENRYWLVQP
jgi:hypothetical protein